MLNGLTNFEIMDYLNRNGEDNNNGTKLNITVLSNITLELNLTPALKYLGLKDNFNTCISYATYDGVIQECLSENSNLINPSVDLILICLYLPNLSSKLMQYELLDQAQIDTIFVDILSYYKAIISGIRSKTNTPVVYLSFDTPVYPNINISRKYIFDENMFISQLNHEIEQLTYELTNIFRIDMNLLVQRVGYSVFFDRRLWHIANAPYSNIAIREIASEFYKYVSALKGKVKKCLVLDCDNVLWGGIVGEDGMTGISLSSKYPGSQYYEFQSEVIRLQKNGIIIALCSKNNEQDVLHILDHHPDSLIRREHVTTYQINWDDKATNIKKIAGELNIGLDSIVFIDDNPFEIQLVESMIPEITTIQFDQSKPCQYKDLLLSCGYFNITSLTDEDKKRGEMYREEKARKEYLSNVLDINNYLETLELTATLEYVNEYNLTRIAQLTQKTNQFNLTTVRYTEDQIKHIWKDDNADCITLSLKDRFGDLGIVGVCIVKHYPHYTDIDTILLSCRSLGRQTEEVLLYMAVMLAKDRGSRRIVGCYIETDKNQQVKNFYDKHGFKVIYETELVQLSLCELDQVNIRIPDFYVCNMPLEKGANL
ncbi:NLI interacting factor-like phosphatase [compost metagenome]